MNRAALRPPGIELRRGKRSADLDIREDVGLSDPGLVEGAISAVGPDGVDGDLGGCNLVVVANEAAAREEAVERIPGDGADPAAAPGDTIVAGRRLPRVD